MAQPFPKAKTVNYFGIPHAYSAGHRLANTNVRSHAHDFTELILVTQGTTIIKSEDKTLTATAGKLVIIPPRLSHWQIENEYVGTSYVGFYHAPEIFDTLFRIISLKNETYLTRWLEDIIDLHTVIYNSDSYTEIAVGLLQAIISRIKQIEQHQQDTVEIHPRAQKALDYIQNHLIEPIAVEEIAENVDISASYLTKLFKKHLGCSPIQYQQKQRMQLACRYLLNPYMTVKQAAHRCGYDDVNFFIRLFQKNHKVSPGKWRKKFLEQTLDTP